MKMALFFEPKVEAAKYRINLPPVLREASERS
jgi:hypothetical protein